MKTFLITIMLLAGMHPPTAGQHRAQNHSFVTRSEVVARHGKATETLARGFVLL